MHKRLTHWKEELGSYYSSMCFICTLLPNIQEHLSLIFILGILINNVFSSGNIQQIVLLSYL
jgi:hypothetical protein